MKIPDEKNKPEDPLLEPDWLQIGEALALTG
jgi:hypothetical protein